MPPKKHLQKAVKDPYIRIPIALIDKPEQTLALAVKQAVEKRCGKTVSWAALFRIMLVTQARAEGVKCK